MITLMACGKGGPILLSLSGCLVGSGVVVRVVLELVPTQRGEGVMFGGGISQGVARHPGYGLPEKSHSLEMGRAEQLLNHELMSIYFNDQPNGFWAKHDVIGSAPMTLGGLKPSF